MIYLYLFAKFIIGGGIIVGVIVLAQNVDPKYGGILAAAPITTSLSGALGVWILFLLIVDRFISGLFLIGKLYFLFNTVNKHEKREYFRSFNPEEISPCFFSVS